MDRMRIRCLGATLVSIFLVVSPNRGGSQSITGETDRSVGTSDIEDFDLEIPDDDTKIGPFDCTPHQLS